MSYRLPAEWEPQEFVLLAWPNETTDWAPYLEEIRKTVAEMVRAIVRHEKVLLLSMFKSDVPDELRSLPNVYVAELPNNDTWARDFGPIVLKSTPPVAPLQWLGREVSCRLGQHDSHEAVGWLRLPRKG